MYTYIYIYTYTYTCICINAAQVLGFPGNGTAYLLASGAQFPCFTSAKVQILTQKERVRVCGRTKLVQKYKY
jgi:hypothetical protein